MSENAMPQNHMELFVRAGVDGKSYGACPFCQRIFMILLLKSTEDGMSFRVTTVNPAKQPPEFKKLSNRLPTLVHGTEVIKDNDEIVVYIDEAFPKPSLGYSNVDAENVTLQVFSRFTFYLKGASQSPSQLTAEFAKINNYLESTGYRFLCGDYLTHLDCLFLPKLQHIRVASKVFKDYDIPTEFKYLWRYMDNAYKVQCFRQSCPSDQEIVHYWQEKPGTPALPLDTIQRYTANGEPNYSWNVPQ